MTNLSRRIQPLTDEEEAKIQAQIAVDPDVPEATDEELAKAKPFGEAFPELMESIKRARGRPRAEDPKDAVTLRVSRKAISQFKADGDNWRARMSEIIERSASGKKKTAWSKQKTKAVRPRTMRRVTKKRATG